MEIANVDTNFSAVSFEFLGCDLGGGLEQSALSLLFGSDARVLSGNAFEQSCMALFGVRHGGTIPREGSAQLKLFYYYYY